MQVLAELRLRHAVVIEARKALGWTQMELARIAGVPVGTLSELECLQFGKECVRLAALKVADTLALERDAVLPPDMTEDIAHFHSATKEVANAALLAYENHARRMVLPSPDDVLAEVDLKNVTQQALDKLRPHERQVLELRYGLVDGCEHTLDACGRLLKLTRERVRQIEMKALNKLREPYNAYLFDGVVDITE